MFWIKDRSLTDTDALPAPDIIAAEIADDLEAALEQFTKIAARLARTADAERRETVDAPSPTRQLTLAKMAAK